MKTLIITIALLATVTMSQTPDTMSVSPFGLDLVKEKVTVADLWATLGAPDSLKKLGEDNIMYYKGNMICYLLIDVMYSIEIKDGDCEQLKIGMKRKEILKKLGKVDSDTLPSREIMEYTYGKNINYIMTLEVKDNRLTKIIINKKI